MSAPVDSGSLSLFDRPASDADGSPARAKGDTPPQVTPSTKPKKRKRGRRTWLQRLTIFVSILLVVACAVFASGLTYFKQQIADVPRISLGGTLAEQGSTMEPVNFLLVGVDNDTGLDRSDPVVRGRDITLNTDTIMVLRIDPSAHKAWILSFPRDLLVTIPGTGSKNRINTALSSGGPGKLVETIKENFQIQINHYVQVNFFGFESLVNAIGGVPVYFDKPARDTHTGLAILEPGCHTLDGSQALAFARSRYYEVQTAPGVWSSDPSSDRGRILRQQEFMRAALMRAIDRGARDPRVLSQLITTAQQNVQLDVFLTTQQLIDYGQELRDFDPASLEVFQPEATDGYFGPAAVLYPDMWKSQPIFDIFRGANPTLNILKTIRVDIRNGSGAFGRAKQVADNVQSAGFTVPNYSDDALYKSDKTIIKYAATADEKQTATNKFVAVVLARYLDVNAPIEADPTIGADQSPLALVVGNDFSGVRRDPRPITDFMQYLTPEQQAAAGAQANGAAPSTTVPVSTTLPVGAQVPTEPPGADCK